MSQPTLFASLQTWRPEPASRCPGKSTKIGLRGDLGPAPQPGWSSGMILAAHGPWWFLIFPMPARDGSEPSPRVARLVAFAVAAAAAAGLPSVSETSGASIIALSAANSCNYRERPRLGGGGRGFDPVPTVRSTLDLDRGAKRWAGGVKMDSIPPPPGFYYSVFCSSAVSPDPSSGPMIHMSVNLISDSEA
ncbi:hypothetical protein BO86DRAFT_459160 [Aspergillus japonicus CBS 114.51]|uniref:Uncharacterized protein n=1 Tax=Aspergillus japonicus CBS 114.51 TaxID=1448312 RepID=A0A8T8WPC7_ASPJA|nr:hypothetical protein BO86DRAFT_459160 [Aspergillus japonicus CBS 114.51]RAH77452.1 hypothetical protein BO86DRAFT_459160 [Aspergillus japonicus CBS 114.51]